MIEVVDNKGHYWQLASAWRYEQSRSGLVEVWCTVLNDPPDALRGYPAIPVPVFTDWWETRI